MNLLLVEDNQDLGSLLSSYLKVNGYQTDWFITAEEGLESFLIKEYDLCILDIMLPGMDGFDLAEKIKDHKNVPFIFLTARSLKEDRIKGLKVGADDYVTKPFEPEELLLRIKNIFKRNGSEGAEYYEIGEYRFFYSQLVLKCCEKEYTLTGKEADLLKLFILNKNQTLSREEILTDLWGENDYFLGRSLDVFISRLRKYLKDDKTITLNTIRGKGFILKYSN